MMNQLLLIVLGALLIVGYITNKKKLNPLTLFLGEWFIIVLLAQMQLYNLYEADNETYFVILVGSCAFAIGYYFIYVSKKKIHLVYSRTERFKSNQKCIEYKLNYKAIYALIAITLIVFLWDSVGTFGLLISGSSLSTIRQLAQQGSIYSNRVFNVLRILVATPFSYALMPIVAMELLKKDKNEKIIIGGIAVAFLRIISDASRSCLIVFGISFLLCFYFRVDYTKRKRKAWILHFNIRRLCTVIFVAVVGAFILWMVSVSRSGERLIRDTYYYFAMEPVMLDKWMEITDESGMIGYGMASFNGFLFPLFYVISNTLGIGYPAFWRNIYEMVESVGTEWQTITTLGTQANSYVTVFWTLYLDGRWVGVVIGMIAYGSFVGKVYKDFLHNMNERNTAIFCMVMIGVFYSFQFIIFKNIYFTLALLMYWFIIFKRCRK